MDLKSDPVLEIIKKFNYIFPVSNKNLDKELLSVIIKIQYIIEKNISSNYDDYFSWNKIASRLLSQLNKLDEK